MNLKNFPLETPLAQAQAQAKIELATLRLRATLRNQYTISTSMRKTVYLIYVKYSTNFIILKIILVLNYFWQFDLFYDSMKNNMLQYHVVDIRINYCSV